MAKKKAPAQKGGAKKAAPVKKGLRAPVKGKQRVIKPPQYDPANVAFKPAHPTVEEQWDACKPQEQRRVIPAYDTTPKPKPSLWRRFRSAVTGLFVSKQYAKANPTTTVSEKVE